jgi:molybdopterin-guanine dinucleotide biosynthesis protein A
VEDTPHSTVSAAILIGGKSRRMGKPKLILRLAPNAPTLIEQVAAALRTATDDLFLVGAADWELPAQLSMLPIVSDGGQGQADGVIAALEVARSEFCIIVAGDMPFLDRSLIHEMVSTATHQDRGVLVSDTSGVHPLHAVYRRRDLPRLKSIVASGERSLSIIAADTAMTVITLTDPARPEAHRWSVFNANTPADLNIARAHYQRHHRPREDRR